MNISNIRWTFNFIFVVSVLLISWQYLTHFVEGELMRILNLNPWLTWLEKQRKLETFNAGRIKYFPLSQDSYLLFLGHPGTFSICTHSKTDSMKNQDDMETWRVWENFWFRTDWDLIVRSTGERMKTKSFDYIIIFSKLPRNINSYFKTNLVISWL